MSTAPAAPVASKSDHGVYRAAVCLVAQGWPLDANQQGELTAAMTRLGHTPEDFAADVRGLVESVELHATADAKADLLDRLAAHNDAMEAFERATAARREELAADRMRLLSAIEVADKAARDLAAIEQKLPRLAG